jgi:hypothetical protein
MELKETRLDLARAVAAASAAAPATDRFRAARQLLIRFGAEAVGMAPASVSGIADIVAQAANAPASPSRRGFAVLIADALAAHGLLSARSAQARLDRDICALLESALPDVLLRFRYPFGTDLDTRRRALNGLPAVIDELLQLPEPTFPKWLSGLPDP